MRTRGAPRREIKDLINQIVAFGDRDFVPKTKVILMAILRILTLMQAGLPQDVATIIDLMASDMEEDEWLNWAYIHDGLNSDGYPLYD